VEEDALRAAGVTLVVPHDEEHRDALLPEADAVISSGLEKVDAELIGKLRNCAAIQCYSVGMNAVDLDAAGAANIRVGNANASTTDVADHTMALLLALQRRLVEMLDATNRGEWDLRRLPVIRDIRRLEGQTLGIVGAGRIGRKVATRARGFGMKTIANDVIEPSQPDPDLEMVSLAELFARSDAIAVCASLSPESYQMINAEVLAHTKPGAFFVNAARGGLVDEAALAAALDEGLIAMAGLDVRDPEPPDPAKDLLSSRPNVIQTPHMAAVSERSREDIHHLVAANLLTMLRDSGRLPGETPDVS
jgi:phosphoglycerate dehydrogenase-like enzyme